MTKAEKTFLCFAAILCGGCIAYIGIGFSNIVEPEEFGFATLVFWLLFGFVLALPFWLPIVIASRVGLIAGVLRLGSLVFLALVTFIAVHQIYFDLNRSYQGQAVSTLELVLDTLIATVSGLSVYLVYRSNRRLNKNDI